MVIFKVIAQCLVILIVFVVSAVILHTLLYTIYVVFIKSPLLTRRITFKRVLKRIRYRILKTRYIMPVELLKWLLYDVVVGRDRAKIWGLWVFTGYFGEGKTLGAVKFALQLRDKYPKKNIKICSNFNMKNQYKKITDWEDILDLPKNTIVIFDEIQSTFTSQKFKEFPIDLLWKITQCRKHGLMVLCTAPVFARMTIQLRENADFVIRCSNVLGLDRLFKYNFYRAADYERYLENPLKLRAHRHLSMSFVASNYDFKKYNTYEIVERLDIEGSKVNKEKRLENDVLKRISNYQKKNMKN